MTSRARVITRERLRELLDYDPYTGVFTNRTTRCSRALRGRIAGTVTADGYVEIILDKHNYKAHHLAIFCMTGRWPADQVDHRDRCRANNAFSNLREADALINAQNMGMSSRNRSGVQGVFWNRRIRRWQAQIDARGVRHRLGSFKALADAVEARRAGKAALHT